MRLAVAWFLSYGGASGAQAGTRQPDASPVHSTACRPGSQIYRRTELYAGNGPGAPVREQAAWRDFLAHIVTPRFPEGLTVIDAAGQWHGSHGIEREHTRIVVIFYKPDTTSDQKIEDIRTAYKKRFKQQSVLRVDMANCLSF